jgi:hypothetical protein
MKSISLLRVSVVNFSGSRSRGEDRWAFFKLRYCPITLDSAAILYEYIPIYKEAH